jgi:PAS domain S-box-containing protein
MNKPKKANRTNAELLAEIERLKARLDEAEQTLDAIRTGQVDAVVVTGPQGEQVFSLTGVEHVYRVIIEAMNEGALTMDLGGYILFCNRRFCEMMRTPMEAIVGKRLSSFAAPPQQPAIRALVADAQAGPVRRRLVLQAGGSPLSVQLSANLLVAATPPCLCMVVSDLTEIEASANSIKVLREQQQALEESQAALRKQEEWLRVTLRSIGDAVIATDGEGRISFMNPVAETLTGWQEPEATGEPVHKIFRIVDEVTRGPADGFIDRVLTEGAALTLANQTLLIARDGREIPVEDSAAPISDRDGHVMGAVLVFQDATDKRQRHEELLAVRDRLAANLARMSRLHEISTRLASSGDLSTLLTDIAEASIEITGADTGSIQLLDESGELKIAAHSGLAQPFLDFFGSGQPGSHFICGRAMADRQRVIVEDVSQSPAFEDHPAIDVMRAVGVRAFQCTPLISRTGEIMGVFSTHFRAPHHPEENNLRLLDLLARQAADLIERIRAREALQRRAEQLEAANNELESFSYSVSHDLRAPLRAIDGFSRMILKKHGDTLDKDAREKFAVIQENTRMMGLLIEDLLSLARMGMAQLSVAQIDAAGLVREIWQELQAANADRRMRLTVGDLPPCRGDRRLLKQAFANLLANAVKFTQGREEALIEAGAYRQGGETVYYIRDNGVGFDMRYADKLFGVFQRLHPGDEFEGTGVGLAIVRRIISRHGGRTWAEGKVDEGATFYVTVPER